MSLGACQKIRYQLANDLLSRLTTVDPDDWYVIFPQIP